MPDYTVTKIRKTGYFHRSTYQRKSFLYVFFNRPKSIRRKGGRYKNVLQDPVVDLSRVVEILIYLSGYKRLDNDRRKRRG